eukprot:TRINITY_DN6915_c0_g1_i1.p1 TRINITY_DN6915_c0_g1~~TRINITY_DN6915_c0_g1_i1.p1  ORF type:complete len:70 (-),score=2.68 TRINITY_DN6915_c0_g1_i1:275-484(-)
MDWTLVCTQEVNRQENSDNAKMSYFCEIYCETTSQSRFLSKNGIIQIEEYSIVEFFFGIGRVDWGLSHF